VEEARRAGLRPILGAELVTDDHRAVLLAKTPEGYGNLCRILSARHCEASFDFIETVARRRGGVIILTDDERAIQAWSQDSPQDLYVELTSGPAMHDALAVSRRLHLPPVATNRVYFIRPNEFPIHRLLRTIALNTTLSRLPAEACCAPTQWLMPPAAMRIRFPHVPEAIDNTVRIADACHTAWDFRETIFPAFRRLSNDDASALLREKSYAGARRRYGTISPAIRRRLEHELAVL
jgi:error-prone DNA polymerase